MPNWYSTDMIIKCKNEEKLERFRENLEKWLSVDYKENSFGAWLGNIVGNSGIGTIDTGKDTDLRCRGEVSYIGEVYEGELMVSTETAWEPMLAMWDKLVQRELGPEAWIEFMAEEPGFGIFTSNDPEYIGKYKIDSWSDVIENDFVNKSQLIKILQDLLQTKEKNLKNLMKMLENSSYGDEIYIHQIKESDIEDWP